MPRYIDAVTTADAISEKLGISLGDLVDIFAEIPTADVVPRSEVEKIFEEIEYILNHIGYLDHIDFEKLKKKYIGE